MRLSNQSTIGITTAVLCVGFVSIVSASDFTGKVVGVIDGDTIDVLHNGQAERIRLNGIDCPEKAQPFGHKAKEATSALVFGKEVTIQTHGTDKYGRTVGDAILPDGTNVNQRLVKDGWCWWYQKYAPDSVILAELQRRARNSRLGLWADPNPIPPWEWRHTKHH